MHHRLASYTIPHVCRLRKGCIAKHNKGQTRPRISFRVRSASNPLLPRAGTYSHDGRKYQAAVSLNMIPSVSFHVPCLGRCSFGTATPPARRRNTPLPVPGSGAADAGTVPPVCWLHVARKRKHRWKRQSGCPLLPSKSRDRVSCVESGRVADRPRQTATRGEPGIQQGGTVPTACKGPRGSLVHTRLR